MNLIKLHNSIAAVCPIHGISIGNKNDKTTWTISFKETATTEQITAARAIINKADISILDDIVYIPKLIIIDRLIALDKLPDALAVLNSDATKKARWDAATEIATDDSDVIMVLAAIGIDPDAVLY